MIINQLLTMSIRYIPDYLKTLPDPQKSEAILDHVMRADWETFGIFLQALDDTGQSHLSDMVRYVNTPTIYVWLAT